MYGAARSCAGLWLTDKQRHVEGAQPPPPAAGGTMTRQSSVRSKPFPGEAQITRNPLNHMGDDSLITNLLVLAKPENYAVLHCISSSRGEG